MGLATSDAVAGAPRAARGPRRGLIVANETARGVSRELVEEVRRLCCNSLSDAAVAWTVSADDVVEQVRRAITAERDSGRALDVVVAVGGDGTVRDVVEALARASGGWPAGGACESSPPLFVVPGGQGNSAYSELWGARPWQEALAAALGDEAHELRRVDLGHALELDRATLIGMHAGFGVTARQLMARAQESGDEADWEALTQAVKDMPGFPGRVTVDGVVLYEGAIAHATVGGAQSFVGGMVRLLPQSRLDDGLLDACVFARPTEAELNELAAVVPRGKHLDHPAVRYAQGRRVTVEATGPEAFPIDHDGDTRGPTRSLTVEAVPAALRVTPAPATEV